ncbi:MAG: transcriptional repressor LexA [bacterium]
MKNITDRQQEILDFIQEFININSYPPTYREIGKRFNIASTYGVKRHLDALQKKGFLETGKNTSRTISVVQSNETNYSNTIEIPIVGRVAAGYPVLSEENIDGSLMLDSSMVKTDKICFALRVKGESMIRAGIMEGDYVIVAQQNTANNGEIVVAAVNDEATLKRFNKTAAGIQLIPENENFSPIAINFSDNFSIIGKVIGVFRWYK